MSQTGASCIPGCLGGGGGGGNSIHHLERQSGESRWHPSSGESGGGFTSPPTGLVNLGVHSACPPTGLVNFGVHNTNAGPKQPAPKNSPLQRANL